MDGGDQADEGESFFAAVCDDRSPAPHDGLDAVELREQITQALDRLPESQKIAIVLNKYEHRSYEEIAEILDCSVMAVKSLLSRTAVQPATVTGRCLGTGD